MLTGTRRTGRRVALESGATWLAVGRVAEEGRFAPGRHQAPILVMGYCPDAGAATATAYDLTLTVTSMGLAEALAEPPPGPGEPPLRQD
jgi:alanine racemase